MTVAEAVAKSKSLRVRARQGEASRPKARAVEGEATSGSIGDAGDKAPGVSLAAAQGSTPWAMVLPQAQACCCLWHQLQGLIRGAREQFPQDAPRRREVIQRGKQALEAACPQMPRTTSPLERALKELRRRIRPIWMEFGSQAGVSNFLRAWVAKENMRGQGQDWLEAFGV